MVALLHATSLSRMISKFCLIIFNVSLDMLNTVIYIFETQATFDSGFIDITFILCNCFAIQLRALRRHSRWNPKQSWMNWPKCSAIEHCAQIGKCFGYSLRTELLQFNARAENIVFILVSSFIRDSCSFFVFCIFLFGKAAKMVLIVHQNMYVRTSY